MTFNKQKCKVLLLGRNNPRYQYLLVATQLESSFAENNLKGLVGTKLNMSQQCVIDAEKANSTLGFIGKVLPTGQRR